MNKFCYWDTEFSGISEKNLKLISASLLCRKEGELEYKRTFWLYKSSWAPIQRFLKHVISEGYVFVCFTEAEARALLTLGIQKFQMIDLYLEYRCLLNHNHEYAYGEQYIRGKILVTTPKIKNWLLDDSEDEDEDDEAHHKPAFSLAAATFKLLGIKIDSEHKDRMRDVCIRYDELELNENRDSILTYNESDVENLPALFSKLIEAFQFDNYLEEALLRGDYSRRTAMMVSIGYPVNQKKLNAFKTNIENILKEAQEECIKELPGCFIWNKKQGRYSQSMKVMKDWILEQKKPRWLVTKSGQLATSKKAFDLWYDSSSPGFAGAYRRFQKTRQSMNGFLPGSKKRFEDYVGSDGRARPYFGIYGAQSSRSQPGSAGFIPLKAHWMRNFLEAPSGKAYCEFDFSSEEFLIAAILSQDFGMMEAYTSGDVYLAFGKSIGLIPADGTKATHRAEREACKQTVLGISYDMGNISLAARISAALKKPFLEDDAQKLIEGFYETYRAYASWKQATIQEYRRAGLLRLSDGWTIWGDNPNPRSVGNFPVQGEGAVVMREAVRLTQDAGISVLYTLHDSVVAEVGSEDREAIMKFKECMVKAFENVMSKNGETIPIRVDGKAWSKDYLDFKPDPIDGLHFMAEYSDEKGERDLLAYQKYWRAENGNIETSNA